MPPVQKLEDQWELVETKKFPEYASFPFEKFNPVQSAVYSIYNQDCSAVIAARTSAGKTVCAEMFMSNEVHERGNKAMYLCPLRALAKEKIDDWTDKSHHFGSKKISICTGDYRLTAARRKELEESDIIIMTSEMLNSRCRNFKSEKNEWLKDIGTIIVDESHLLTVPGRGDHLEVGLMTLSQIAKDLRIVFLSATMPNVNEIADWISYELTGKQTHLLVSEFRPCPLGVHYERYWDGTKYYDELEQEKVNTALQIVDDYSDDKFLIFAHTKRTGNIMLKALRDSGYQAEFHNANLEKAKREKVEKSFRDGPLDAIVATSTLAWGLNLPARRVIILGVHRGLNEVDTYDIWQMAGRAGRVGLDPRGDVYVLVPEKKADYHQKRLGKHQPIVSRLLDYVGTEESPHYKTLAFHICSEIHHGGIKTVEDIHKWYEHSLAHFQAQHFDETIVDQTVELLKKFSVIREEEGELKVTGVGKVSSMFYYSPFDASNLRRNFTYLFKDGVESNDIYLSMALGNIDTHRGGICNRQEKEAMDKFAKRIRYDFNDKIPDAAIKAAFVYYCILQNGNAPPIFNAFARTLQQDFPRTKAVLDALDNMSAKWEKESFFKELEARVSYGVPVEMVDLVKLPNVGAARARALYSAGFRTPQDLLDNKSKAEKAMNLKSERMLKEIYEAAKLQALTSGS
mgnify:CR=1 FL=1